MEYGIKFMGSIFRKFVTSSYLGNLDRNIQSGRQTVYCIRLRNERREHFLDLKQDSFNKVSSSNFFVKYWGSVDEKQNQKIQLSKIFVVALVC